VCFGSVLHVRHLPVRHRFVYPMFFLRLPLSRLDSLGGALLGIDRPRPMSLQRRDHGPRNGEPLLPWIRDLLRSEGLDYVDGEVVLQTLPRILGYVFNPVSFWFCHDRGGVLRAVLCEVSNTFGEHHNYLVVHEDGRPIAATDTIRARKVFHVSPFFPVRGEYRFRFGTASGRSSAAIDYHEEGRRLLTTRLTGQVQPLTAAALTRALLRFPLQTFGVVARIHWQALRLWLKRVPLVRKPVAPELFVTR
jgi:DUF1365 family protein